MNWLKAKLEQFPAVPPAAPVASWPAEWREAWEERAAVMEFDGGLTRPEAEAAAVLSVLRVKHPQGALVADWLQEMDTMRRGDDPGWRICPPETRGGWADQMIELAKDEGFYEQTPADGRVWLENISKARNGK